MTTIVEQFLSAMGLKDATNHKRTRRGVEDILQPWRDFEENRANIRV